MKHATAHVFHWLARPPLPSGDAGKLCHAATVPAPEAAGAITAAHNRGYKVAILSTSCTTDFVARLMVDDMHATQCMPRCAVRQYWSQTSQVKLACCAIITLLTSMHCPRVF